MELAEGGDLLTHLRQGKLRHEQYVSVGPDGTLREQKALMVTDHSELMLFAWHIAKGMSHLESLKVRRVGFRTEKGGVSLAEEGGGLTSRRSYWSRTTQSSCSSPGT